MAVWDSADGCPPFYRPEIRMLRNGLVAWACCRDRQDRRKRREGVPIVAITVAIETGKRIVSEALVLYLPNNDKGSGQTFIFCFSAGGRGGAAPTRRRFY